MSSVHTTTEVLDAIQQAKTGASAFCTNFFPVQAKLQTWIDHNELLAEKRDAVAFFFRKDRDFWHFYFAAASPAQLQREITILPNLKSDRVVLDLVGSEASLAELLGVFDASGFHRHARLVRLARAAGSAALAPDEARAGQGGLQV